MNSQQEPPEYTYVIPGEATFLLETSEGYVKSSDKVAFVCGGTKEGEFGAWLNVMLQPQEGDSVVSIREIEDALQRSIGVRNRVMFTMEATEVEWTLENTGEMGAPDFEEIDVGPGTAELRVVEGNIEVEVDGIMEQEPKRFSNVLDLLSELILNHPEYAEQPKEKPYRTFHKEVIPWRSKLKKGVIQVEDDTPLYLLSNGKVLLGEDWKGYYKWCVRRTSVSKILSQGPIRSQASELGTVKIQSAVVLSDCGKVFVILGEAEREANAIISRTQDMAHKVMEKRKKKGNEPANDDKKGMGLEECMREMRNSTKNTDDESDRFWATFHFGNRQELLELISADIRDWAESNASQLQDLHEAVRPQLANLLNRNGRSQQFNELVELVGNSKFRYLVNLENIKARGAMSKLPWIVFKSIKEYIDWHGELDARIMEREYMGA
jgi:hypothetical protein